MTTSIVIPCVPQHFGHIFGLLYQYEHQTCIPDQIVISLSESECMSDEEFLFVENYHWPFELKIIKNHGKRSAGENRTIGSEHSCGDLILLQDADDIPHPQRVEIVKYIFEHYFIDHLMHSFFLEFDEWYYYHYEYLDHLHHSIFPI